MIANQFMFNFLAAVIDTNYQIINKDITNINNAEVL